MKLFPLNRRTHFILYPFCMSKSKRRQRFQFIYKHSPIHQTIPIFLFFKLFFPSKRPHVHCQIDQEVYVICMYMRCSQSQAFLNGEPSEGKAPLLPESGLKSEQGPDPDRIPFYSELQIRNVPILDSTQNELKEFKKKSLISLEYIIFRFITFRIIICFALVPFPGIYFIPFQFSQILLLLDNDLILCHKHGTYISWELRICCAWTKKKKWSWRIKSISDCSRSNQIIINITGITCAPISEFPSNTSTMVNNVLYAIPEKIS